MIAFIAIVLLIWTVTGLMYFITHLGFKNTKGPWYEGPLMLPVIALASLVWIIGQIVEKIKGN